MHALAVANVHSLQAGHHVHQRFSGPHADYVGVGLAALASWVGVSGPGEVALIAAGIAAAHHRVDIGGMLAVAWAGAMIGGVAGWLIGLKGGRSLVMAPGPLHRMRLRMLAHGDRVYERRGMLAVYFAPSWMAGISGMRPSRFIPANAVAALVWSLLVGLGAFWIGPSVADILADIGTVGLVVLVVLVITSVVLERRRRRGRGP
jgi:membrane-associated protein